MIKTLFKKYLHIDGERYEVCFSCSKDNKGYYHNEVTVTWKDHNGNIQTNYLNSGSERMQKVAKALYGDH